ncbi:protein unc-45 homolog B-like [Actinia tenebrosa]|uniref:Protein unc-45 homolog B n=1 Tax=Actinia tenebrosa TaxID=6105 RepID=A0A6P8J088_ACTTE|nr:protein unc-45 homolog B-like [Actinia tenebrosa]
MAEEFHQNALALKEEGNDYFKKGDYEAALVNYTKALNLYSSGDKDKERLQDKATVLKNRAACHLKLENYEDTVEDCTNALEVLVNDSKALYRRCQALEHLGRLEEAFKDIHTLTRIERKNSSFQVVLRRLGSQLQAKSEKVRTTDGLVSEMFTSLFGDKDTEERKKKALKNLVILSKEEAGAQKIFQGGEGVKQIISLLNTNSEEQIVAGLLVLKGLCTKSSSRASAVLHQVTMEKCSAFLESPSADVCKATVAVLHAALDSLSDMPTLTDDLKQWYNTKGYSPPLPFKLVNEDENKAIVSHLLLAIRNEKVTAVCRDECIDAFVKTFPKNKLLVLMFMEMKGLALVLEVAAMAAPLLSEDKRTLQVSENTRMHISVLLASTWDSLGHDDKNRGSFTSDVEAVIMKFMKQTNVQSHIEGCTALCALIQGCQESASSLLKSDEITNLIVALSTKEGLEIQIVAAETLALATSDKTLCSTLGEAGLASLKHLYHLKNDRVRVRALVGLCKLGTTGGGSAEDQTFAEGATLKLYKSVQGFLTKSKNEMELRKWAAEGLSFLSMDAEVKEEFINDNTALHALIDLTKCEDSSLLYGVCQTLVNLTNTFDKPEIPDEMKKLGEFAKVKMPKLAEKDGEEYVKRRIDILVKEGIVSSLVQLCNTESLASREMIARVFCGIVTHEEHRGITVQQGGVKALLSLAEKNTEKGMDQAVQALAKIAISLNPEFAFPGHKSFGLIRPLIKMLHPSKRGLAQFEALLALTNLAQLNDDVRKQIIKQKGIPDIEMLMFDEDEMLKRAATECMCNMILCEEVSKMYENEDSPTERVKLMTCYSGEEDVALKRAASGALAMLTASEKVCRQVVKVNPWLDIVKELLLSDKTELKFRGVYIVNNMMAANKEIATKLVESEVLEILMVLSKETTPEMEQIHKTAENALSKAVEWELIKPSKV